MESLFSQALAPAHSEELLTEGAAACRGGGALLPSEVPTRVGAAEAKGQGAAAELLTPVAPLPPRERGTGGTAGLGAVVGPEQGALGAGEEPGAIPVAALRPDLRAVGAGEAPFAELVLEPLCLAELKTLGLPTELSCLEGDLPSEGQTHELDPFPGPLEGSAVVLVLVLPEKSTKLCFTPGVANSVSPDSSS